MLPLMGEGEIQVLANAVFESHPGVYMQYLETNKSLKNSGSYCISYVFVSRILFVCIELFSKN